MYWIILLCAIFSEVTGTISMKLSQGFTRLTPTIAMIVFHLFSFIFFTFALKKIDVSVAYAVWSGLGTGLVAVIGFYLFKEQINTLKLISLFMIILGVVGLELGDKIH